MRRRTVFQVLVLVGGCRIYNGTGEVKETIWVHHAQGAVFPDEFADRYSAYYNPNSSDQYLYLVGVDGDLMLFATRVTHGGLFGGIAGTAWRDRDVVGYAPTGRVGNERTAQGREWQEYQLLGGSNDSPRVAEAILEQPWAKQQRP